VRRAGERGSDGDHSGESDDEHGRLHGEATVRGYDPLPQLLRQKEDQIAIRIRIPEAPSDIVHVASAPLCEAVLSLHVLMHPKEHPLQHPWIRQMRRLTPALKAAIALGRAECQSSQGEYAKAIEDFTAFIRLRPKDPEGYEMRAVAFARVGNGAAADADLREAEKLKAGKK